MNGQPDATAVSHDTHPWELASRSERRILSQLMAGAEIVCLECNEVILPGDARIAVCSSPGRQPSGWRCGDCEYRSARA